MLKIVEGLISTPESQGKVLQMTIVANNKELFFRFAKKNYKRTKAVTINHGNKRGKLATDWVWRTRAGNT